MDEGQRLPRHRLAAAARPREPSGAGASAVASWRRDRHNGGVLRTPGLVIVCILACSGCVGFREGLLPRLARDDVLRGGPAAPISYRIDAPSRMRRCCAEWRDDADTLFRDAFVEARRGPAADEPHVEIRFEDDEDLRALAIGLRALWLVSLGISPAWSRVETSLGARVEHRGRVVREYRYTEARQTWAHLLLLPFAYADLNDERVLHALRSDLLLHLVRDLRQDLPDLQGETDAMPVVRRAGGSRRPHR